jgi:acetyl-CoA carboxylase/biotin carboxylase 1
LYVLVLCLSITNSLADTVSDVRPPVPQSPGKLVRQLVQDGEHVVEGQAFAEIEVMKMIQTLVSPAAGVISFQVNEGSALAAGALIATLELDDPTKVKRAETFTGEALPLSPRHACISTCLFQQHW